MKFKNWYLLLPLLAGILDGILGGPMSMLLDWMFL